MSAKISILAASPEFLFRKGIASFVSESVDFKMVDLAAGEPELLSALVLYRPNVLIIDCWKFPQAIQLLRNVKKVSPETGILIISDPVYPADILSALDAGATGMILKECESAEITDAVCQTALNNRFLCGKVIEKLGVLNPAPGSQTESSCAGLNVTEREIEIIRHVAEGLSNKEIAEKLFLSPHTVNTHRKNIMNKLQVNNTAGLVLFAVRNSILGPNKYLFS